MQITNKNNLPEAIVKAVKSDSYDRGQSDFTVTELLKPPRQTALTSFFYDQITEDAADLIYRLYGQITHKILHQANGQDVAEKRFFSTFSGRIVSGQIDSLSKDGILTDYKFCTAWKFMKNKSPDPDFVAQLNMLLELLRRNGLDAKKLQAVGLIRDFRLREAKANPDSYPSTPIVTREVPIWPRQDTVEFIETRIKLHEQARIALPECSKDERWAKDDIHAVMKGKKAMNGGLKTTHEAALEMHKLNPGSRLEFRPAQNKRCEAYCAVSPFCIQYKKLMLSKGAL